MGKILVFSLFISFIQPLHAEEAAQIKKQMEAGFNLTAPAAEKLFKKYKFKDEKREDFYADIYDGEKFLLIPGPQRFKFRMKMTNKGAIVQANTKDAMTSKTCAPGWEFNIKEKSVGELALDEKDAAIFSKSVVEQLDLLEHAQNPEVPAKHILDFHHFVLGLKVPLMEKLLTTPQNPHWYFVASHQTKKVKSWMTHNMGHGKVEVSITHGWDYVGSTLIQEKYEIEFQPKNEMSIDDLASSICKFMEELGLANEDLNPVRTKAQIETLKRLERVKKSLGF